MRVIPTAIPGVLLLEPRIIHDERGFFFESWRERELDDAVGAPVRFVQENVSRSSGGVLRGLHYQLPPREQGKLVRVTRGAVYDVAVDLRRSSPTFRRWVGFELSDENNHQMWIPGGCAHGFLVLSASAEFAYKLTDYYAPETQQRIRWDDPELAIRWPGVAGRPSLSPSDADAPLLAAARLPEDGRAGGAR